MVRERGVSTPRFRSVVAIADRGSERRKPVVERSVRECYPSDRAHGGCRGRVATHPIVGDDERRRCTLRPFGLAGSPVRTYPAPGRRRRRCHRFDLLFHRRSVSRRSDRRLILSNITTRTSSPSVPAMSFRGFCPTVSGCSGFRRDGSDSSGRRVGIEGVSAGPFPHPRREGSWTGGPFDPGGRTVDSTTAGRYIRRVVSSRNRRRLPPSTNERPDPAERAPVRADAWTRARAARGEGEKASDPATAAADDSRTDLSRDGHDG